MATFQPSGGGDQMEHQSKVTVDFTIKGADPNAKLDPSAECEMCGRTFEPHRSRITGLAPGKRGNQSLAGVSEF